MILYVSSPRERTDREELLKKKKRERERECAPILLRRNRRRRDLTVSCLKCACVCVARVNFLKKVKPFVLFQTKGAERAGDIFFLRALLKSEAKKKFHLLPKSTKRGNQQQRERESQHFRLIFSPFIKKRTHEHKHAHTRAHALFIQQQQQQHRKLVVVTEEIMGGRKTPATPSSSNENTTNNVFSSSSSSIDFQSPRFQESLHWLQSTRRGELQDKAKSVREDVMKLRRENEKLAATAGAATTFRDISNNKNNNQRIQLLSPAPSPEDMQKMKTEMLLLRAQLLELDSKERKEIDRTAEEMALRELKLERERRIHSTEKLKGKLFELQTAHEKALKECKKLKEDFEKAKYENETTANEKEEKLQNILRSSEQQLQEVNQQLSDLQEERETETEKFKSDIESAILVSETRANEAELQQKDLEMKIKTLKTEHEEEIKASRMKIEELENACESIRNANEAKESELEKVTEKYTEQLKLAQEHDDVMTKVSDELKANELELQKCKLVMEEMIAAKQQKAITAEAETQTSSVENNADDDNKDKEMKEEHEREIQSMQKETTLEKDALRQKITALEASVKSLEVSLRDKREESDLRQKELRRTREELLTTQTERDEAKASSEKALLDLSSAVKTTSASENENAFMIAQLNIEIELLKRTLNETEEALARAREEVAQSKVLLTETTESLSKAREEAAKSARALLEAREAPPVVVEKTPETSTVINLNINEGDVIQSDHIQELTARVLDLRQQLEAQKKILLDTELLRVSEREAAATQVRALVVRTSDLLSGRINSSLLVESSSVDEGEGGNVVEYVAGTLDSWFGLGKEEER